jgi:outer membrane protein OmpA-like peptidoglycan-associated protein
MAPRIIIVLFCLLLSGCSKPIAVLHWSAKDGAVAKKGRKSFAGKKPFGVPNHKWYSRVICFDDKCRNKAEWVKKQREHRFKGFKDGGKLPTPPPRRSQPDTTIMIAAKPGKPPVTQDAAPVIAEVKSPETIAPKSDSLIVLNEVLFAVNSYKLRSELFPKLDSIVTFLKQNPSTKIEISGHTDNTGSEAHNLKLSENRADAVAEYIVDKGIATSRVSFNGYGSARPIDSNDSEKGRRRNRRVEILIHDRH